MSKELTLHNIIFLYFYLFNFRNTIEKVAGKTYTKGIFLKNDMRKSNKYENIRNGTFNKPFSKNKKLKLG